MKKLFTIDDFMVAFISALGYGFGETISKLSGWSELWCVVACFAVGIACEEIISAIVFSKTVQRKPRNRVLTFAAILLIFLVAHSVSVRWMGVSMLEYLQEEFLSVIGMPFLGFIVNMLIRFYHVRKIRERYGDGSEGYVFDVESEDIEETNRQNRPIPGDDDAEDAVKTRTGIYVGEKQGKTMVYLGIPYAKPPVGERRWKAPEPLLTSTDVFEAKHFGASAIQVEHKGSILKQHRQSEDCLYLNVFVSDQKTETKKPVLVLFHHGDFTYGGSADPLLYGDTFAENHPDTLLVSFDYRLGILGFIDFSEVPGGEAYPDALNLGLLDQIAALQWIKENIAAFGGDPDRITVLGFESGAISICLLAADPRAKGLFHKAFVFNGNLETVNDTPEAARALAKALLKETNTETMDQLLQLQTKTLKDATQRLWSDLCAPTLDGTWLPADMYRAYQDGKASGIKFIIGTPGDETRAFRSVVGGENYEDLLAEAVSKIENSLDAPTADAIREYIRTQAEVSTELEAKSKLVQQWIALGIYRVAARLGRGGNKVYLMYWDEKALIEKLGSGTVDAAAALLGNGEALQMYGSVMNEDLSEALQTLLHKFVHGNALQLYPNEIKGVDAFNWKPFPEELIVSDGKFLCDGRRTEVMSLLDFVVT